MTYMESAYKYAASTSDETGRQFNAQEVLTYALGNFVADQKEILSHEDIAELIWDLADDPTRVEKILAEAQH